MNVYTYSQAWQKLAVLLDEARADGEVQIKRRDGQSFTIKPIEEKKSVLDVPGVDAGLTLDEINAFVREGRER